MKEEEEKERNRGGGGGEERDRGVRGGGKKGPSGSVGFLHRPKRGDKQTAYPE